MMSVFDPPKVLSMNNSFEVNLELVMVLVDESKIECSDSKIPTYNTCDGQYSAVINIVQYQYYHSRIRDIHHLVYYIQCYFIVYQDTGIQSNNKE